MKIFAAFGVLCAVYASAPALAATPVENFGKLPYIQGDQFALSPKGDRIAFVASAPAGRQLVIRELASNKTLLAENFSKVKIDYLVWAGEDHVLMGARMTSENTNFAAPDIREVGSNLVVSLNGSKPIVVFRDQPHIWSTVYGYEGSFEIGGKWYAFFDGVGLKEVGSDFNRTKPEITPDFRYMNLYRVDLDSGEHTIVAGHAERVYGRAVSPSGDIVAHSSYVEETGDWSLNAGLSGAQVLSAKAPLHDLGLDGLGTRPGTVIVTDRRSGIDTIAQYDIAGGGPPVPLFKDEAVDELIHDRNNYLIGAVVGRDKRETVFLDPAIEAAFERATKPFKGSSVTYISADADWKKWLILTEGDGDSGTYYLVDLAKGTAEAVATTYPDIDPGDVGPVRMISYKAGDGLELKAVLTLPPNRAAKNLPVVVLPHGGPEAHDTVGFDWLAQAFASQGYAVLQPNFRGSTGGSEKLHESGYGQWGRKMQTDVSDGLAELVRQGVADPKRACIVGASYGGYVALAGVTVQQGLYRCAVSYAGPAELSDMLKWERDRYGDHTSIHRFWGKFMGAQSDTDPALREISPADLAAKADAPILLIHGKLDSRVPIEQSRTMAQALRRAGKTVQLIELDGEDHFLSKEPSRVQMIKAAVDFVKSQNPPS